MYSLGKPSDDQIRHFITSQAMEPFSYSAVGASQTEPPPGHIIDHNRTYLGNGPGTYQRARAAIQNWSMFQISWVQLFWPTAAIVEGSTVGILARALGLWSLNACRIVYVMEEQGAVERFGFAYGTLPDHAEQGEERFSVEWHRQDNSVWYDILAFSRPKQPLAIIGFPYVRRLQKRFAQDSMQAMVDIVSQPEPD